MPKCDYCGNNVPLFHRVVLDDGRVCKKCFHWANYGGYGMDDGSHKKLAWIDINIKRRDAEVKNFTASFDSGFGLSGDDAQRIFAYDGWTHSYSSIHSFNAFLYGKHYEYYVRTKKHSNCYRKPVKKTDGTCVFLQLEGYTYPSYIKITLQNERQFFECLTFLRHMCGCASDWEAKFRQEMDLMFKGYELASAQASYERDVPI